MTEKLTIEKVVIEKCCDQKVNNWKCGDENMWWLKPMATKNLATKTCGDWKTSNKILWQQKIWWLNSYVDKRHFNHHMVYDDWNDFRFAHL